MPESGASPRNAEFDLLLACVDADDCNKGERICEVIANDLDWRKLVRITKHHRLVPQVYRSLLSVKEALPAGVLHSFRELHESHVRQALRLTRDLIRVLHHFAARGISVLAYKGPALAAAFDGDVASRQYSDIDLLVNPSEVQKSRAALIELGYTPHYTFTKRQEKSYIRSGYEYAFDLPGARNALELKWRIVPLFYAINFDIDEFFERSITVKVADHPVRTLCAEDLLLVLCVHAAKHAWQELSLLSDISRLIQSQAIQWDATLRRAQQLGVQRLLRVTLKLTRDFLGTEVPGSACRQIESKQTAIVAHQATTALHENQQIDTESISYFRLMMSARERRRDRARFLARLAFTPGMGEWSVVSLPDWMFPLYYAVRVYRVAARAVEFFQKRARRIDAKFSMNARLSSRAQRRFRRGVYRSIHSTRR